ncbi:hypothetical protein [Nakamurella sp.]|uniref:hypothetical protein n=1 Tax=Nakamurella sp. TaxID=1869182 RepID=UPI003782F514
MVCAIDTPDDVHLLVNEDARCRLGILFVAGGLARSTLAYWSVDPTGRPAANAWSGTAGNGALHPALEADPVLGGGGTANCATPSPSWPPGSTMEAMRYVTGSEPSVVAAEYHVLELADGEATNARRVAHPQKLPPDRPGPPPMTEAAPGCRGDLLSGTVPGPDGRARR